MAELRTLLERFRVKESAHAVKMVVKIYGHPTSTCTQRVLFTLEELGAHYELCLIDMPKGEHKVRLKQNLTNVTLSNDSFQLLHLG